jgi:hypothetical protein
VPLEILHRAAPCRNVPVTFTLAPSMWPFTRLPSYSKNLDVLVAVITHLGYTDWNMRSAKNLSKALALEEEKVLYVLENFPAFFRKAQHVSAKGTSFYQLHVRHAIRWKEDESEEESKEPPLEPSTVNAMIDVVVKCADQERRHSLGYLTVTIAALVSVAGAVVTLFNRHGC